MAKYKDVELPDELYYDRENHIWTKVEGGNKVRCGVDQFGQKAAGTVAYISLKPAGSRTIKGRAFGSLEAGKYIGPLKATVNGTIVEVNKKVLENPKLVNSDPYGDGWMVVIEASNLEEDLKDLVHGDEVQGWLEADYEKYTKEGLFAKE